MINTGALPSALLGTACAALGIYMRPRIPSPENVTKTIAASATVSVPVLGWILWHGQILATSLPFLATTVIAGEIRDRRQRTSPQQEDADTVRHMVSHADMPETDSAHTLGASLGPVDADMLAALQDVFVSQPE